MLTLDLENFAVEFADGTLKTVGAADKAATVKLYDVTDTEARAFGDSLVKLTAEDDEGNAVEVALDQDTLRALRADLRELEMGEDWPVFE
jgi:hypothetical protein